MQLELDSSTGQYLGEDSLINRLSRKLGGGAARYLPRPAHFMAGQARKEQSRKLRELAKKMERKRKGESRRQARETT